MIIRIIIFLVINFGALSVGSFFTRKGASSVWYTNLTKAPWTPPGWVFGFAWTTIMICFSIYMAYLWGSVKNRNLLLILFVIQWFLNVSWNPVFFYLHHLVMAMVIISTLTALIGFLLLFYLAELKIKTALLLPYFIWLLIASSLNAYIILKN